MDILFIERNYYEKLVIIRFINYIYIDFYVHIFKNLDKYETQ